MDQPAQPSVPLLDLIAQHEAIRPQIDAAIRRTLDSGQFILGAEVEALEREIASYCHARFAVGVSSGTDALLVSLMACGIGPGDEVIVPTFTFFATAGSVARVGARPIFADIDPLTLNLDPADAATRITARTKAIIPVHLYGQSADMASINELARDRHLVVIEDAAQAIGAEYRGQRAGAIGQLGCLSFFPSKNLGALGDGGMVICNDEPLADRVRLLRTHGYRPKYYNQAVGGNFRLDAIQAAVLRVKLQHLDGWTTRRQRNAALYRHLLDQAGVSVRAEQPLGPNTVALPHDAGYGRHVYNQFVIRVIARDALRASLANDHIGTEIYYPVPMHQQPCFAQTIHPRIGSFPHAEAAAAQTLALPVYPELGESQIEQVVGSIASFLREQPS